MVIKSLVLPTPFLLPPTPPSTVKHSAAQVHMRVPTHAPCVSIKKQSGKEWAAYLGPTFFVVPPLTTSLLLPSQQSFSQDVLFKTAVGTVFGAEAGAA